MKVKIVKSSGGGYWYSNKIGEFFYVTDRPFNKYGLKRYKVIDNPDLTCHTIDVSDCEVVNVKAFDQKQSCADVVKALKRRSKSGLSVGEWCDMGHGADLRKRISELVRDGYTFRTVWEPNKTTTGRHKRYWLLSYKREK